MNSVEFSVLRRGDVVMWGPDNEAGRSDTPDGRYIGLVYHRNESHVAIVWENGKHDAYSVGDAVVLRPFEVSE